MQQARLDPAALDALFAPFDRTDAPGFAVGVSLPGRAPYRRGFGMASIELPVALSPTIRMRIGSTTKHFCVLAVMLLVEEGRLSLDDSPRRHIPELPQWAEAMTVRQLMAHTSGMRDAFDLILHASGPGLSAAPDMLFNRQIAIDDVDAPPGSTWSYNNGSYVLLGEIVERLSRRSFADFLTERILRPVGMHDTTMRALDTDLLANSATLHVPTLQGGWSRGIFGVPIGGMGGLVSTVDDMLLWLAHMSRPVVGTAGSSAAMRTPLTTHGYGLGLFMDTHRGLRTVHHAGGVVGGCSQMLKVLDHELDLIIMSNGRSGFDLYGLVDAIIDACIPGLPPVAKPAPGPATIATFHSATTGRVLSMVDHEGRQALAIGGSTLPTQRQPDGSLSVAILPSDLRVRPVHRGDAIVALEATEFGTVDRLDRLEPPEDNTAGAELAGRYENPSAAMTATIATDAAGKTLLRMTSELGGLSYALTRLGPALWQARATGALALVFTLEVTAGGFSLSTGRTRRLAFDRAA